MKNRFRAFAKWFLIGIIFGWAPSGLIALVLFSDAERNFEAAFLTGLFIMPFIAGIYGATTARAVDDRR